MPTAPISPSLQPEGSDVTENDELFAVCPFTVTPNTPELALAGTTATMPVFDQFATSAVVPFKVIVLLPCAEPKFVPVIATEDPTAPELGEMLVIVGACASVRPAHARTTRKATVKDSPRIRMNASNTPTEKCERLMKLEDY